MDAVIRTCWIQTISREGDTGTDGKNGGKWETSVCVMVIGGWSSGWGANPGGCKPGGVRGCGAGTSGRNELSPPDCHPPFKADPLRRAQRSSGQWSGGIGGLWQCSACVRQCKLWCLPGWRISPSVRFPGEIIPARNYAPQPPLSDGPMGTTAFGGRGAVSGDRPIGAASCRPKHTKGVTPNPPTVP